MDDGMDFFIVRIQKRRTPNMAKLLEAINQVAPGRLDSVDELVQWITWEAWAQGMDPKFLFRSLFYQAAITIRRREY